LIDLRKFSELLIESWRYGLLVLVAWDVRIICCTIISDIHYSVMRGTWWQL